MFVLLALLFQDGSNNLKITQIILNQAHFKTFFLFQTHFFQCFLNQKLWKCTCAHDNWTNVCLSIFREIPALETTKICRSPSD